MEAGDITGTSSSYHEQKKEGFNLFEDQLILDHEQKKEGFNLFEDQLILDNQAQGDDLMYEPIIPLLEQPKQGFPFAWTMCGLFAAHLIGVILIIFFFIMQPMLQNNSQRQQSPPPSPPPSPPSPPPPSPPSPPPPAPCGDPLADYCDINNLIDVKNALPQSVQQQLNWTGDDPCNDWKGITCSTPASFGRRMLQQGSQRVTGLNPGAGSWRYVAGAWQYDFSSVSYISGMDIKFPVEISSLAYLETLEFDSCELLMSPLPPELSVLTNLRSVGLQGYQFSGSLPPQYSTLTNLEIFGIAQNSLKDNLPVEYSTWTKLKFINMSRNLLTGQLPVQYSNWNSIEFIDVSVNFFTGKFPDQYTTWLDTIMEIRVAPISTQKLCIDDNTLQQFKNKVGSGNNQDLYEVATCNPDEPTFN